MNWSFRYLLHATTRSWGRTLLSLLLSALLCFAFGQLTALRQIYARLYQEVRVDAVFSGGLSYSTALKMEESGYLEDAYYELNVREVYLDFQNATLCLVNRLDKLVPEPVTWLEGWDEETAMSSQKRICVLTRGYAERMGLELGDQILCTELDVFSKLVKQFNMDPNQMEKVMEKVRQERPLLQVVGLIETVSQEPMGYVPIAVVQAFYFIVGTPALDLAIYGLVDYHQAAEFRDYTNDVLSRVNAPVELQLDTGNADRIYQIHLLLETLYPLVTGAALLLEGVLSGLTVLHFSRDISILRALGVKKRRTVGLYAWGQLIPALLGAVLGLALAACIGGVAISAVWEPLLGYFAAHLLVCALGSGVFAWLSARKHILALLQTRE